MKKCAFKIAVAALAFSFFSFFGCETVVTDVNAELAAMYPEEDLGIPVNFNENYMEVAYNPSAGAEETSEEDLEKTEEKTQENKDELSENDTDEDTDELTSSKDETNPEDIDEDGEDEDSEDDNSEDADTDEDSEEDLEEGSEEDSEEDLNASMAEDKFDAEFYAKAYPDVVAVFGDSPEALYKHYQDYGKAEGRSCNEEEFALLNEAVN